jgi:signal transduction histidine kinase
VDARVRVAAGIALVTGVVLLIPEAWFSPRLQVAASAAGGSIATVVVAMSAARYRTGRDTHSLFLMVGFAAVAVQSLVFGVWWPIHYGSDQYSMIEVTAGTHIVRYFPASSFSGPAPVYAFQFGWLVAGLCFILGVPWWDRRGHRAIWGWLTMLSVAGVLLLFDRLISLGYRHLQGPQPFVVPIRSPAEPEAVGTVLGITAAAVLAVAAGRELFRRTDPPHPWLGVAFAAAVALPMSAVTSPSQGLAYIQWADLLQLIVPAIAIGALLSAERADVTRMRRATDRAEEVLGGRAEIASVIAHDVRSPVSSIKSIAASTIGNYERLDDAQRLEFVAMIDREAQHVLDVVHQMSVALKIDAGTLDVVRRTTSVTAVVRQAIDDADTRGRSVEIEATPGVEMSVDGRWLAEAIRQGIDNAVAYSSEGTPIKVSIQDEGDGSAVIAIADEGSGIASDRREAAFERFTRWPASTHEDVPRSGLGLFICRGIVRELGGEATLENGVGRGTILRISLPWGID